MSSKLRILFTPPITALGKGSQTMSRLLRKSLSLVALALVAGGAFLFWQISTNVNRLGAAGALADNQVQTLSQLSQTIPISATPVSAVGAIELITKRQVVLETSGMVEQVAVVVGDQVKQGDLLIALNTKQLEWAVTQAEIGLEKARVDLEKANEAIEQSDFDQAEANLLSAKENLALVQAGPTKEELEAAKSSLAAAWASYNDLKAGPKPSQLTQAKASLKQAEIAMQQAQRAYDKIAWQPDAGASGEGAALQNASIAYESAKASYDELVAGATQADLQSALAGAQSAQDALNKLQKKPTPADVASAKASVASAQGALDKLKKGKDAGDVKAAELAVQSAEIGLEQAKLDLSNARVLAPMNGIVLEVNVEPGQQGSSGTVVTTVADTSKLKLVVNVEQKDISQVKIGQKAEITIYGLNGQVYHGVVDKIAPQGESSTGTITFPVTIRLTDDSLANLKPGMNATATFVNEK